MDKMRAITLRFLAVEALELPHWSSTYRTRMEQFDISIEDVEAEQLRLFELKEKADARSTWTREQSRSRVIALSKDDSLPQPTRSPARLATIAALALFALPLVLVTPFVVFSEPLLRLLQDIQSNRTIYHILEQLRLHSEFFLFLGLIIYAFVMERSFPSLPPQMLYIGDGGLLALRGNLAKIKDSFIDELLYVVEDSARLTNYTISRLDRASNVRLVASVCWDEVEEVYLEKGKTAFSPDAICFRPGQTYDVVRGTRRKPVTRLFIGDLLTAEIRSRLLGSIRKNAPGARIDPAVVGMLEPEPDMGYTELWISALSASPERRNIELLSSGTVLNNKYNIVAKLGGGGQGTIYLARRQDANGALVEGTASTREETPEAKDGENRPVVVKEYVLPVHVTRHTKKQFLEGLENEARILERLDHPSIVKLLDFFVEDHRGYLVFEYIEGENLRQLVESDGPLPESRVRDLAIRMCDILAYLHEQNPPVLHRDFTPDNLLLGPDGQLKLIDFTVASAVDNPMSAIVCGKRSYMPPEQLRGQPSTRSDLYALGATLAYLLTGEEPEPLTSLHPGREAKDVSTELDSIVARLTELSENERFDSALAVRRMLAD